MLSGKGDGLAHSMVGDGARYAAKRRRPERAAGVAPARVVAKAASSSARLLLLSVMLGFQL